MGILEAATQRMKMEEANYEARIAALQAELETVKGDNVRLECQVDELSEQLRNYERDPVGLQWKRRAEAAEAKLAGGEARQDAGAKLAKAVFGIDLVPATHPAPTHNDGNGEAVAYTTPGQLQALSRGLTGTIFGKPDEFFTVPLYTRPAHTSGEVTEAARDVLAERERQKSGEGWTAEHDDEHDKGEMAGAAACYAMQSIAYRLQDFSPPPEFTCSAFADARREAESSLGTLKKALEIRAERELAEFGPRPPKYWPWQREWWKPSGQRRDLVKAGALILAEIERRDRAALRGDAS